MSAKNDKNADWEDTFGPDYEDDTEPCGTCDSRGGLDCPECFPTPEPE